MEKIPTEHKENINCLQEQGGGEDLHPWRLKTHLCEALRNLVQVSC